MVEQKYIDYWRARQVKRAAQVKLWEKEAWTEVDMAVAVLREQFKANKIVVFGSLVKDKFGQDSDIDIAASGIAPEDFFTALAAVNRNGERWIDLKPIESLEPRFKSRIFSTGKTIYENN